MFRVEVAEMHHHHHRVITAAMVTDTTTLLFLTSLRAILYYGSPWHIKTYHGILWKSLLTDHRSHARSSLEQDLNLVRVIVLLLPTSLVG